MSRLINRRRTTSAVNALSDSETEGSQQDNVRKKRSSKLRSLARTESTLSNHHSHSSSLSYSSAFQEDNLKQSHKELDYNSNSQTSSSSKQNSEFNHTSGSNACFSNSPSSPVIDISTVQYSPVDKFRWLLWRSIYLKIIRCVNFDVWLLSRIHDYRKLIVLLLFLPFLAYFLYAGFSSDSQRDNFITLYSNVISFPSYLYSHFSDSSYNKHTGTESSSEKSSYILKFMNMIYAIFLALLNLFSSLFTKISESVFTYSKSSRTVIETSKTNTEDLKLIVMHMFEDRLEDIVKKVKESPVVYSQNVKLKDVVEQQSEIRNLHLEFQALAETVKQFEEEVTKKSEQSVLKYGNLANDHSQQISLINEKLKQFEEKLLSLSGTVKTCCEEKWSITDFTTSFESHFIDVLKRIVNGDNDRNSPYYFFIEWMHSKLEHDKNKLSEELKLEFKKSQSTEVKFDGEFQTKIENVVKQYAESFKKESAEFSEVKAHSIDHYSLDIIQKLIKEAILLYDADKTGRVDYALESGGGSVLSTRCSESYAEKEGTISVLGFSLWSTRNSPRTAIQPSMQPGECWAFKGSQGFLVVQLSYTIYPTGFTLEHIPVSLSPSGSIDSAPKNFSVWGLVTEKDNEGILLGSYSYSDKGEPLQYFSAQNTHSKPFEFIELKIHSNHGNLDYTCLYRFRVHGNRPKH